MLFKFSILLFEPCIRDNCDMNFVVYWKERSSKRTNIERYGENSNGQCSLPIKYYCNYIDVFRNFSIKLPGGLFFPEASLRGLVREGGGGLFLKKKKKSLSLLFIN